MNTEKLLLSLQSRLRSISVVHFALLVVLILLMVVANLGRTDKGRPSFDRRVVELPGADSGDASGEADAGGADSGANSADRVLFWVNVRDVLAMTDADLAMWKGRGLDGFVAQTQWLEGMGSDQRFTSDPHADLSGSQYAIQRQLRDTNIVGRAKAAGMKLYLAFYLVNGTNLRTPLAEWFDDGGWSIRVLPRVRDLAGAAKHLGFDGLALDLELYPQSDNVESASWSAGYKGNTRTDVETRRAVFLRGQQFMQTIVEEFPDVELQIYGWSLPGGWEEYVRERSDPKTDFNGAVQVEFFDGVTSVEGYRAVRFADAFFYKGTQLRGSTWDAANQYNLNGLYATFSKRLSNWDYASSRLFVSPFSWIDDGATNYGRARAPDLVAEQLEASRIWGTGGEFLNYAQGLLTFDYGPYLDALRAASTPAVVDTEAPTVSVTSVKRSGSKVDLAGTASDNLGVQAVRSSSGDAPGGPTARMTWNITGGNYDSIYEWEMAWELTGVDVADGATDISVTAVDVKGLSTTIRVPIGA